MTPRQLTDQELLIMAVTHSFRELPSDAGPVTVCLRCGLGVPKAMPLVTRLPPCRPGQSGG